MRWHLKGSSEGFFWERLDKTRTMGEKGTDRVLRKGAYLSLRVQSMCWSGTFSPAFPTRFWTAQAHCWTAHATEQDFNIEQTEPHTARGPPWHLLGWKFRLTFLVFFCFFFSCLSGPKKEVEVGDQFSSTSCFFKGSRGTVETFRPVCYASYK